MRIFGGERIAALWIVLMSMTICRSKTALFPRSLEGAQKKVEGFHFDQRKNVVQYDDVMNRHRKAIYAMRQEILKSEDISKRIKILLKKKVIMRLSASPLATTDNLKILCAKSFRLTKRRLTVSLILTQISLRSVLTRSQELYAGRRRRALRRK